MLRKSINYFFLAASIILLLNSCGNGGIQKVEPIVPGESDVHSNPYNMNSFSGSDAKIALADIDKTITLAASYYSAMNYAKAAELFLKVYEVDSNNQTALVSLGNVYYDSEQNEKSIEFYEKFLVFEPENVNVRCDLGTVYMRAGMLDRAIEITKKNTEINFEHHQSHHNLSIYYKMKGNVEEAAKEAKIYDELKARRK